MGERWDQFKERRRIRRENRAILPEEDRQRRNRRVGIALGAVALGVAAFFVGKEVDEDDFDDKRVAVTSTNAPNVTPTVTLLIPTTTRAPESSLPTTTRAVTTTTAPTTTLAPTTTRPLAQPEGETPTTRPPIDTRVTQPGSG